MQKPRVLIVCDYSDTVYDRVSASFMRHLTDRYEFTKIFTGNPSPNLAEYDVIYCLWWRSEFLQQMDIPRDRLCIQVASFWSWQRKFPTSLETLVSDLGRAAAVSVNCPGLHNVLYPLLPAVFLNPSGVDTSLFVEQPARHGGADSPLVVGWAGSSRTHGHNKGLYDIILPACDGLPGVVLNVLEIESNCVPHEAMPRFYQSIDVYVCASISEGTPNPVLEAASSGRAVISTMVGIVPMLIRDGVNGIVIDRSISSLREAIVRLRDDRELCRTMGRHNSRIIRNEGWEWAYRARQYAKMFDFVVGNNQSYARDRDMAASVSSGD